jgi:oligoribonuclease
MDDWNQRHHGESGLVELVKASDLDEAAVETRILDWLKERCRPATVPLAGNSVHQDRAFLRRWMPGLHDFLHYRNVDVSTVKELLRRRSPEIVANAPAKTGQHRALDDIRESIRELRHYRENAFALRTESDDN